MNKVVLYCRPGFEKECAAEITDKAAKREVFGFARVKENAGYVVFECYQPDDADTLARELREELGVALRAGGAHALGTFEDDAVNEPGRRVQGESFLVQVDGTPRARAEIAELAWIPLHPPHGVVLAPLSERHVLPAVRRWLGAGQAG